MPLIALSFSKRKFASETLLLVVCQVELLEQQTSGSPHAAAPGGEVSIKAATSLLVLLLFNMVCYSSRE